MVKLWRHIPYYYFIPYPLTPLFLYELRLFLSVLLVYKTVEDIMVAVDKDALFNACEAVRDDKTEEEW